MGSETRRTTETIAFRLTPEEMTVVRHAAEGRAVGLGAWSRRLILNAAGASVPPYRAKRDRTAALVGRTLGELGRVGSNINQIAKVANSTGDTRAAEQCCALLDEIRGLHADLLALADGET